MTLGAAFDNAEVPAADPDVTAGLFAFRGLGSPAELEAHAQATVDAGHELHARIVSMPAGDFRILELIDDLSDLLCRAADPAQCIRQLHPDEVYHDAATTACQVLGTFMGQLNTDTDLYHALNSLYRSAAVTDLDEQSERTMGSLMSDFEQSGIHLPPATQAKVVELCEKIQQLEFMFENGLSDVGGNASIDHAQHGKMSFRVDPSNLPRALSITHDPAMRTQMYDTAYECPEMHSQVLDQLLTQRNNLAKTVGYDSFAHMELKNSMVGDPATVLEFLTELRTKLEPKIQSEIELLSAIKSQLVHDDDAPGIRACDRPYYSNFALAGTPSVEGFEQYFSVGNCFDGLTLVTERVFGVAMKVVAPVDGEVWHNDVRKLEIVHETEGLLGVIYCDLFERPGKPLGAAHYTIQTGREVRDDDGSFDHYQNPIVVLTCGFAAATPHQPSLLAYVEVETLFHEMGHALHSMFARTKFQTVAGTRSALDFVELPSHLLEFFVRDYRVVSQFARHPRTGEPIPRDVFETAKNNEELFIGMSMVDSLVQSTVDQDFHSADPLAQSTTETLLGVQQRHSPLKDCTAPLQYRYGHLCGYATGYYSYLWCQALASMVWHECFIEDPLSRSAGDRVRRHLLEPGGGSDPWKMVTGLLGYQPAVKDIVSWLAARVH